MADLINMLAQGSQISPVKAIQQGQVLTQNDLMNQSRQQTIDQKEIEMINQMDDRQKAEVQKLNNQIAYIAQNAPDKDTLIQGIKLSGGDVDPQILDPSVSFEMARDLTLSKSDMYAKALSGNKSPASVQEWQYYNSLSDTDKQKYLEMKRNPQWLNLGGSYMQPGPTGSGVSQEVPKTLPPEQTPEVKGEQSKAAAIGKAEGEAVSKAVLDYPQMIADAQQSLDTLDGLLNSQGLEYITGIYSKAPVVPGTVQAEAKSYADQLEGQTFLNAYKTLKGGGQITEVEGAKATAARNRLLALLKRGGKTSDVISAANEYKGYIKKGVQRAQFEASGEKLAYPRTAKDFNALPSGKAYVDPDDGNIYRKP